MSITREDVQRWTREELRRILDMGLMYTDTSKNAPQAKPELQQTTADGAVILSKFPDYLAQHLKVEGKGRIIRNDFVSREYWMEMNNIAMSLGYKWLVDPSNSKNNHWEKQ